MKRKTELDSHEKQIEAESPGYVPVRGTKKIRIEGILEKARKTKNINIRISEYDLARLRQKSEEEGIPCQTLISSVLHKFISERLVDEKEILKSLQLLENRKQ
jgi:predicted DNA binding CopG/RHH family protein